MRHPLRFQIRAFGACLIGALATVTGFLLNEEATARQNAINALLVQEGAGLDRQIRTIAGLETEIASLQARQMAVQALQADRNLPTLLLAALAEQIPEGMVLGKLSQTDNIVTLSGHAKSNEQVATLLRNLGHVPALFTMPEVIEVAAALVGAPGKDQRRVFQFSIKVRVSETSKASNKHLTGTSTPLDRPLDGVLPQIAASAAQAAIQGAKALRDPKGAGL